MNGSFDYSKIDIEFSQNDIKKAMTRPRLAVGWYSFVVTGAVSKVNDTSGNMSIRQTVAPLDSEGNTRRPSAMHFITLPLATPPALLEAAEIDVSTFTQKVPDTLGLVQGYLRATRGNEFPTFPKYQKSEGLWSDGKGGLLDKEEKEEVVSGLIESIYGFLKTAWGDPTNTFKGDTFFARIEYREGSDFADVRAVRSELPGDAELVDLG